MKLKNFFTLLILFSVSTLYSQQWKQNFKIVAPIRSIDNAFGSSISTYDGFAAFGVDRENIGSIENAGKVYIAKQDCDGWSIYQELTLSKIEGYCGFGALVVMDGKTLAVYGCDPLNPRGGNAIYMYERDANDLYVFTQKIAKPEDVLWDNFGLKIALSGNQMVVGASYNSTDSSLMNFSENAGAAYIYYRDSAGVWSLTQKIVASDRGQRDNFGGSVAISGNTVVIGAENEGINWAGAAYVFEKNANSNTWSEIKKLIAYDYRGLQDRFGGVVKINEDVITISASREDDYDSNLSGDGGGPLTSLGSVYIFKKNSSGDWAGHQKIRASDGSINHFDFGSRMEIYENKMAISGTEYEYDTNGNLSKVYGRVYMFQKDNNDNWKETQIIQPKIRHNSDYFGGSFSLHGENLFVGAFWDALDANEQNYIGYAGSVYLFNTYDYIQTKKPELNAIPFLTSCADLGNGFSSGFDMSSIEKDLVENPDDFIFSYKDKLGNNLPSPLTVNYSNKDPFSETIYIRVGNKNNPNCYKDTQIELKTTPSFTLNTIPDLYACEPTGSGYAVFDLSKISSLLVHDTTLYKFSYFDSTGNDISALINESYKNTTKGYEEITLKVTDISTLCTVKTKINLNVSDVGVDCNLENNGDSLMYNIPNFFTPNNDGINDIWKITEITNQNYSIYIYDRYGKLLKSLGYNEGWDGSLNEKPLPSTDYWFQIIFANGTNKMGHFSLKR
ncbi:T9SS type B sorting domain-containing protein [Flavobacterium sp. CAN_S2]|uniref:T9SS type B sorting domain-containing protein n=1 Tax=Flavobacterium sp. CAN_S2 TaxID=2787726 RepID=UPI0018CAD9EA